MAYKSFLIKKLSITKLPGFSRGLKDFDELGEHINIVYGPNASGKSSTARIIQQLIWPKDTHGIDVKAHIKLGGEPWNVHINSSHVVTQNDGLDKEFIGIPTIESKKRYLLELSGLMSGAESDLAQKILQDSNGGYDLNSARETFNYSPKAKSSTIGEVRAYDNTTKAYDELINEQRKLKGDQEKLVQLEKEKKKAELAQKEVGFYELAIERLNAELAYKQLEEKKNQFPEAIKKVTKSDFDNSVDFEDKINSLSTKIDADTKSIKAHEERLSEIQLPDSGVSQVIVDDLRSRIERLKDVEQEKTALSDKIDALNLKEKSILKNFNDSIKFDQWEGINLSEIQDLDKHIREAYPVLAKAHLLKTEIKQLEDQVKKTAANSSADTLKSGIEILGNWLKESDGTVQEKPKGLITLLAFVGILTGVLTYFSIWGLLGIAAIVILLVVLLTKNTQPQGKVKFREDDFKKSGLSLPAEWQSDKVSQRIDELIKQLYEHHSNEVVLNKKEERQKELNKLTPTLEEIYNKHQLWLNSLQVTPDLPDFDKQDFSSLYWFIHNLKEWQDVHLNKIELISKQESNQKVFDKERETINRHFKENNFVSVTDYIGCKSQFDDIVRQKQVYDDAKREIKRLSTQLKEHDIQKEQENEKLSALYLKLKIEEGDKEKVRELVSQMTDFQSISNEYNIAKSRLDDSDSRLTNHSLFKEKEAEIELLSPDELADKKRASNETAHVLEKIKTEITEIKTLVDKATHDSKLEDALVAQDEAIENLEAVYLANLASVTGDLIIEELKSETETKNRPALFKRADELLGLITNGRYQLRLSENDKQTNFRAFDTVLETGLDLSELSDGTRVQLLLAVRLAYIESIEEHSKIKLPLLADELLANSDDLRAKAIIEALIKISKEGRQVFYFTAQADEVAKWQQYLNENQGLDNKIHAITGQEFDYAFSADSADILKDLQHNFNPPSADGLSHEEYGKQLGVGSYNLISQGPSEAHLWYFIDDIQLLQQCLTKGITHWGQLRNFYENGGKLALLSEQSYQNIKDKAMVLARFQELYQHGRIKPIDRSILEESGLITAAFIDEVSSKTEALEGNPLKLIEALENREVSKFRSATIEELKAYFIEHGYIDEREILSSEDIRSSMTALLSNLSISGEEAEAFYRKFY